MVFRIAFVVLSVAGGSGVLLYLVGWALVPDDRTGAAAVNRAGRGRSEQVVAAVVAGIGIIVLLDELFDHHFGGVPVGMVLLGVGPYVLLARRQEDAAPPTGPEGATSGPGGPNPPPGVAPPPPPPWGRGRLLIPVGLLLSAALVAVSVVDVPLRGGVGERDHRPQTLVELDSPYRLAAGDMTVDLRRLDLAGVTSRVVASVGAGELLVLVPDDVALDVVAEVGAGELEVLHRLDEGLGVRRRAVERGREGQGGLVLRVRVGVGELEVRRAAA